MDNRREMPPHVKALDAYAKEEIRKHRDRLAAPYQKGFVRWYIGCLRSQPYGEPEPTIFLN